MVLTVRPSMVCASVYGSSWVTKSSCTSRGSTSPSLKTQSALRRAAPEVLSCESPGTRKAAMTKAQPRQGRGTNSPRCSGAV